MENKREQKIHVYEDNCCHIALMIIAYNCGVAIDLRFECSFLKVKV